MAVNTPLYIYPDFLGDFACTMCGTCCRRNWQVTVDEACFRRNEALFAAAGRLDEFSQAFAPLTAQELGEYAYIAKHQGACWFLTADNRCHLQRIAVHDHLDTVCQTYPRYPVSTARGLEVTLSFSCPAVLQLVNRNRPITFVRSDRLPLAVNEEAVVAHVFPRQQGGNRLMGYYFEIEQHIIDILQWRARPLEGRLDFLAATLEKMSGLETGSAFADGLNRLLHDNYEVMAKESDDSFQTAYDAVSPQVLVEHFLVNLVFKKVGYLHGFTAMLRLLRHILRQTEIGEQPSDPEEAVARVQSAIMELELAYSHNRKSLIP